MVPFLEGSTYILARMVELVEYVFVFPFFGKFVSCKATWL